MTPSRPRDVLFLVVDMVPSARIARHGHDVHQFARVDAGALVVADGAAS